MSPRPAAAIAGMLDQLDRAFDRRSWHGPNLMGALRGLHGEVLGWRPQPDRHNIAELAVHAAYWKYRAFRLITDAPPRSFELRGSNFLPRPRAPTPPEWAADMKLLEDWQARLRAAVAALAPAALAKDAVRGEFTVADVVAGVAAHDLYHAGQIQLIRRMYAHR
jgi:hypothetical protein